jgi:aminoglycoside phosphotransferase (APT) family kinase protein
MVTNQELNEQKEASCIGITPERKYFRVDDTFVKRSLRRGEWQEHPRTGETLVPRVGRERLLNEASAMKFVANNTAIPVPKLHTCFEDDGAVYLIMEYVEGRGMDELEDEEKLVVQKELEHHLQQLHELKSGALGGPSGIIIPPYRVQEITQVDTWNIKPARADAYVFCHNDISQHNVIVSLDSLKICAIIDWEYAGYWPERFDRPFYKRLGPSVALENEEDDAEDILRFLEEVSERDTL